MEHEFDEFEYRRMENRQEQERERMEEKDALESDRRMDERLKLEMKMKCAVTCPVDGVKPRNVCCYFPQAPLCPYKCEGIQLTCPLAVQHLISTGL